MGEYGNSGIAVCTQKLQHLRNWWHYVTLEVQLMTETRIV